jgi:hypothetical protein
LCISARLFTKRKNLNDLDKISEEIIHRDGYLQWACPSVQSIICVDSQDFLAIQDVVENPLMEVELWNCVAKSAKDDIQSGGWKSSYTGEHMSAKEVENTSTMF